MVFSDPPYGVNYESKNEFFKKTGKRSTIKKILNDDLKPDILLNELLLPSFKQMKRSLKKGGAYYLTGPGGSELILIFLQALKQSGLGLYHMLTWVKNSLVLGRSDYNYKHENIFIGWKELEYESQPIAYGWNGSGHKFYGTSNEVTVWNINRPSKSELHPTMKPVELMVRAIHNSTMGNDIVADFFGGSGSTMIACEQTGRICYMIELLPENCRTIIERWEVFTGKKAVKNGR